MTRIASATFLFFLVASAARTAVVLRRGPSKSVQMLRWDLSTDEVLEGQWLKGRVHEHRCDVSPDGRLFLYFGAKYTSAVDTFTAICRPPYFTALAYWPSSGSYGGGGRFANNRTVILDSYGMTAQRSSHPVLPDSFTIMPALDFASTHPVRATDLRLRGWVVRPGAASDSDRRARHEAKANPIDRGLVLDRGVCTGEGSLGYRYRIDDMTGTARSGTTEELGCLDWADWDHDGSLLLAKDGRLSRRPLRDVINQTWLEMTEVADLRHNAFTPVAPPQWARRWPR